MEAVFDAIAKTYDEDFTKSKIGRLQRNRVWNLLEKELEKPNQYILEVGCGTGEDAMLMGAFGHRILATDSSKKMIEIAKKKTAMVKQIEAKVCEVQNISSLKKENTFDLVFSDFGALNCLSKEDLENFSEDAFDILKVEGKLVLVFISKNCFWEKFYFLLKFRWKSINRRGKPAMASLNKETEVFTYYYSTKELKEIFKEFKLINRRPIGLFIPPSYLEKWFKNKGFFLSMLNGLERTFASFSSLTDSGDHAYFVFQKTPHAK